MPFLPVANPLATALAGRMRRYGGRALALLMVPLCVASIAHAHDDAEAASRGQTIYVPVYSQVHHGNLDTSGKATAELVSVQVSIRNTDTREPIRILAAPYYDSNGRVLRQYISGPRIIPPMGTLELFVEHRENEGGSGANFMIRWESDKGEKAVSPPIVEALHTRIQAGKTLAFISRGKAVATPLP